MENFISQLPSPIEVLLNPLSLAVLGMYIFLIVWEALLPARPLPSIKYWRIRGLTFFTIFFFVASYLPMITDPFLAQYQLINLTDIGVITGSIIGILIYDLGSYAYHVIMHRFDFLWRTFHQMHHSAERLDTYGALFHSPLDAFGFTIMGSLCIVFFVGLPPQSITVTLLAINFIAFFQHANIKTPRWIGYIVQRPESHSLHHGRGIHKYNFANIPIIDMFFGTFKNPKNYIKETGFYDGASARVMDMLMFKDISSISNKENRS